MDQFVVPLAEQIQQAAAEYVTQKTVVPINFAHFQEFLTSGRRDAYEHQYFARRREMAVLALAVFDHEERATLDLLQEVLWVTCDEYTWAVPAHLPRHNNQYTGDLRSVIELFGAECGQALGMIVAQLGTQLDPLIVSRIKDNVQTRLFTPFLEHEWFWEHSRNNWSAVIAGSIGMAAMNLLEKNSPQQQAILAKVEKIMMQYLDSYSDDGACVEGVGYWVYGFGYYLYFATQYQTVFGDARFLTPKKIKAIAAFPAQVQVADQQFLPFSDYASSIVPAGLRALCATHFGVAVPTSDHVEELDGDGCYRFAHLAATLAYGQQMPAHAPVSEAYLPDVQWWIKRLAHGGVLAAKGGRNDESHNHLDVGEWLLGVDDQWLVTDLGAGEYTRQYFTEATRYAHLTTAASGHNIPQINGQEQQPGAFQAQTLTAPGTQLCLELQDLYPPAAGLESFIRQFTPTVDGVQISDHLRFSHDENVVSERLVTRILPQVQATTVTLSNGVNRCLISAPGAKIAVSEQHYLDHHRKDRTVYVITLGYRAAQTLDVAMTARLLKQKEG